MHKLHLVIIITLGGSETPSSPLFDTVIILPYPLCNNVIILTDTQKINFYQLKQKSEFVCQTYGYDITGVIPQDLWYNVIIFLTTLMQYCNHLTRPPPCNTVI